MHILTTHDFCWWTQSHSALSEGNAFFLLTAGKHEGKEIVAGAPGISQRTKASIKNILMSVCEVASDAQML